jgi:hypothetical protein
MNEVAPQPRLFRAAARGLAGPPSPRPRVAANDKARREQKLSRFMTIWPSPSVSDRDDTFAVIADSANSDGGHELCCRTAQVTTGLGAICLGRQWFIHVGLPR